VLEHWIELPVAVELQLEVIVASALLGKAGLTQQNRRAWGCLPLAGVPRRHAQGQEQRGQSAFFVVLSCLVRDRPGGEYRLANVLCIEQLSEHDRLILQQTLTRRRLRSVERERAAL
jgi:hypothetical protein